MVWSLGLASLRLECPRIFLIRQWKITVAAHPALSQVSLPSKHIQLAPFLNPVWHGSLRYIHQIDKQRSTSTSISPGKRSGPNLMVLQWSRSTVAPLFKLQLDCTQCGTRFDANISGFYIRVSTILLVGTNIKVVVVVCSYKELLTLISRTRHYKKMGFIDV